MKGKAYVLDNCYSLPFMQGTWLAIFFSNFFGAFIKGGVWQPHFKVSCRNNRVKSEICGDYTFVYSFCGE